MVFIAAGSVNRERERLKKAYRFLAKQIVGAEVLRRFVKTANAVSMRIEANLKVLRCHLARAFMVLT